MDNITHTLAGAALGEAGLKRRTGLGMAALMIGANLPDIDALAIPFGENLAFRRGWTHGPLAMLVLPVLLTLALLAWDRWRRRRGRRPASRDPVRPGQLLLLSCVGVLSHPALDWLNTYGIRLLMPFSERWFYGDSIFIIDPWIWAALGLGVLLARRRARAGLQPPGRPARAALALVAVYVVLMIVGSRSAHDHAVRHARQVEGVTPRRVMAGPVPLDPSRRELIWDMGDSYRAGSFAWRPGPRLEMHDDTIPVGADHPAVARARLEPEVRGFLRWSRFPYFVVEDGPDGVTVAVGDMRFRRDAGAWFRVVVELPAARAPHAADSPADPGPGM